jgi:hypothetical protein
LKGIIKKTVKDLKTNFNTDGATEGTSAQTDELTKHG